MQGDLASAIRTLSAESGPDHLINTYKRRLYLALVLSAAGRYQEALAAIQAGIDVSIIEGTSNLASFICYIGGFIQLQRGTTPDMDCHQATQGRTLVAVPVRAAYDAEVAMRDGNYERASELIEAVEFARGQDEIIGEPEFVVAVNNLRIRLEVELLVRQGNIDEAVAMMTRVRPIAVPSWGPSDFVSTAALNLPLDRDALAQALADQGRTREAILEYELLVNPDRGAQQYELVPGIYYYRLGVLYEQSGDAPRAADNYREFLKAWENADPELPQPNDARKRLAALSP